MARHHKVHELLSRDELDQLEAFTREPGRTVDEVHEWLLARGFTISRGAVHNWKREFDVADKFRASNDVARVLMEAAKGKDTVAISDAASLQLSQLVFEQLVRMQQDGSVDTRELTNASAALKNVITGKRHLEKLQEEVSARQKTAVEEAEKVARSGGGNEAVIGKVREILGV